MYSGAMPQRKPESAGAAIVLLGSFNPSIFHPSWFARRNLISPEEADADNTKVEIMHKEVTQFETENFTMQITTDRFYAFAKPSTPGVLLRDLVIGTFYILEHTPVRAVGINRSMHFQLASEEEWHLLGDRLAPKDGWKKIFTFDDPDGKPQAGEPSDKTRPGLVSLTIIGNRKDRPDVKFRFKIEPSAKVRPYGVYFETNEHYDSPNKAEGLSQLLTTLMDRFEDAQQQAERDANLIIDWALSKEA